MSDQELLGDETTLYEIAEAPTEAKARALERAALEDTLAAQSQLDPEEVADGDA